MRSGCGYDLQEANIVYLLIDIDTQVLLPSFLALALSEGQRCTYMALEL
jgi:hypothetical protein